MLSCLAEHGGHGTALEPLDAGSGGVFLMLALSLMLDVNYLLKREPVTLSPLASHIIPKALFLFLM